MSITLRGRTAQQSMLRRRQRTLAERAARRSQEVLVPQAAKLRASAVQQAITARERALDWAGPRAAAVSDWAGPRADVARQRVSDAVDTARTKATNDVMPKVAATSAAVVAAATPLGREALSRADAAILALRGELSPSPVKRGLLRRRSSARRGSLRSLAVSAGVVGGLAAGWRAWSRREGETWHANSADLSESSSYAGSMPTVGTAAATEPGSTGAVTHGDALGDAVPTTTPASAASAGAPAVSSDDAGGASPDEALADASTSSGAPLAPMDPDAGVVDVRDESPLAPPLEADDQLGNSPTH